MRHLEGHVRGDEYALHNSVQTIVNTSTCPPERLPSPRSSHCLVC
jgi:hypothetical protein